MPSGEDIFFLIYKICASKYTLWEIVFVETSLPFNQNFETTNLQLHCNHPM
jgi:hypothetical protein